MKPVSTAIRILTALAAVIWPLGTRAAYFELIPGGAVTIGTESDARLIWTAFIRLGLVIMAMFIVVRLMKDSWLLKNNANADVEAKTIDALTDAGKMLVLTLLAATATPYAVNLFFNFIGGAYQLNLSFG